MTAIKDESVQLIVTSPPYPMIEMWDELFTSFDASVSDLLRSNPLEAFERMHQTLDAVWQEAYRVLAPGGFCCVNIGDATRTLNGNFRLFSSHSRIIQHCTAIGFTNLPPIIWRKPTNAPTKFMGSGMLPAGAYITYEHEYILIFRKGGKREFNTPELKKLRNTSAYFWEERNIWFSDLWQFNGTKQAISQTYRTRSAAYPLELPFRLINMYSVYGDTILDPFMGTGTTSVAAIITGRNSIGYEIDKSFKFLQNSEELLEIVTLGNKTVENRIQQHLSFVQERLALGKDMKYSNEFYGFPVMTTQERQAKFLKIRDIGRVGDALQVEYTEIETDKVVPHGMRATA